MRGLLTGTWVWGAVRVGSAPLSSPPPPPPRTHSPPPRPPLPRLGVVSRLTLFLPTPSRLSSGKLQEFGVGDGSKLTLVPTVEAGLMVND